MVDVIGQGFDAGIRFLSTVPLDMVAVPFGEEVGFICVATPAYLDTKPALKTPQDLLHHDCIRYRMPDGRRLRWTFCKAQETYAIDVSGQLTLNSISLVLDAARKGYGIGYVPEEEASTWLKDGRLVEVLADWFAPYDKFALYYASNQNTPKAVLSLSEALRQKKRVGTS